MRYLLVVALVCWSWLAACSAPADRGAEPTPDAPAGSSASPTEHPTGSPSVAPSAPPTVEPPPFVVIREEEVDVEELDITIEAGDCTPDPVISGHTVDCTFPLDGDAASMERLSDRAVAYLPASLLEGGRGWMHAGSRSGPCRVDASTLVCPNLVVWHPVPSATDLAVSIGAGDVTIEGVSSVRVLPESSRLVDIQGPGWTGSEWAGVFADVPQRFTVRRTGAGVLPVWGLLRPLPARAPVRGVALLGAGEDEAAVPLAVDEPGTYELVPCLGTTADDCTNDPSGTRLQAIEPLLEPLFPGTDGQGGLDVIVTGRDFHSHEDFLAVARTLLDPDALPIVVDGADGRELHLPLFTVEPLRSFADTVNLWVLPHPFDAEPFLRCGMHYDDLDCSPELDEEFLDLSVLGVTNPTFLVLDAAAAGFSEPTVPGIRRGGAWRAFSMDDPTWTQVPPTAPSNASSWRLGASAGVSVEVLRPWTADVLLLHEIGHSWFGLEEEYGGPDQVADDPDPSGPFAPNCASTRADANRLWGDIMGSTDPFAAEYEALLDLADVEQTLDVVTATQVGIHAGGSCGIKPSANSVMAGESQGPVFGPVNRRWAEQILTLWD